MISILHRSVLIPILAGVVLVIAAFFALQMGQAKLETALLSMQHSQERSLMLVEMQALMADAESEQRGYVLTGDEIYLAPYEQAKDRVASLITALNAADSEPSLQPLTKQIMQLSSAKLAEFDSTIALYGKEGATQALALARTKIGQTTLMSLRDAIAQMRVQENELIRRRTSEWAHAQAVNRALSIAGAVFTLILIGFAGYLANPGWRHRTMKATDEETHANQRNSDLSELFTHSQRVSEAEKSGLARELHDELGGLLVGIKMDLAQLRSKLDLEQPDVKKRWDRIQGLLSSGIELKRRVIEQLRPSLLDNMGLVAAIHWQVGEICGAAGLESVEHYPEEEPILSDEAAIAIFRVAQESLKNIVKHAQATRACVEIKVADDKFVLTIEDNGIGLPLERSTAISSHGISSMRHRLFSFGGMFAVEPGELRGTRLRFTLPMSRIVNAAEQAA